MSTGRRNPSREHAFAALFAAWLTLQAALLRPAIAVRPWRHVTIWQVGTRPQADGSPLDWDRFEGTREELEAALCTRLTHAIDG